MPEPNGGSSEYNNIINNLDGIGNLIEEEVLNKKIDGNKVQSPLDEILGITGPLLVGATAVTNQLVSNNIANFTSPKAIEVQQVVRNNIVNFTRKGTEISQATQALETIASQTKTAIPQMIQGGIRSIINFATQIPPLLLRVFGIVGIGVYSIFEVWKFCDTVGRYVGETVEENVRQDLEIGSLKVKVDRLTQELKEANQKIDRTNQRIDVTNQRVESVEKGLVTLEKVTNQKIFNLQQEIKGVKELIKTNHTQSMSEFNRITENFNTLNFTFSERHSQVINEFDLNKQWQVENRAAVVATLSAAATASEMERPNGLLKKAADTAQAAKDSADDAGNIGRGNGKKIDDTAEEMKKKFNRLGSMFDIGLLIDLITMVTSLHNAAMLSRDIFNTCVQVIENGVNAAINAFGYKGINDESVDLKKYLGETVDHLGKTVLGAENWQILKGQWAAANRITAAGNAILNATREIAESTNQLAEAAAENSGKVGNMLRASGVTEDIGKWFPENYSQRSRLQRRMEGLTGFMEGVSNTAQGFENFTSEILSITENVKEIKENSKEIAEAWEKLEPKPTKENKKVAEEQYAAWLKDVPPEIKLEDLKPAPPKE